MIDQTRLVANNLGETVKSLTDTLATADSVTRLQRDSMSHMGALSAVSAMVKTFPEVHKGFAPNAALMKALTGTLATADSVTRLQRDSMSHMGALSAVSAMVKTFPEVHKGFAPNAALMKALTGTLATADSVTRLQRDSMSHMGALSAVNAMVKTFPEVHKGFAPNAALMKALTGTLATADSVTRLQRDSMSHMGALSAVNAMVKTFPEVHKGFAPNAALMKALTGTLATADSVTRLQRDSMSHMGALSAVSAMVKTFPEVHKGFAPNAALMKALTGTLATADSVTRLQRDSMSHMGALSAVSAMVKTFPEVHKGFAPNAALMKALTGTLATVQRENLSNVYRKGSTPAAAELYLRGNERLNDWDEQRVAATQLQDQLQIIRYVVALYSFLLLIGLWFSSEDAQDLSLSDVNRIEVGLLVMSLLSTSWWLGGVSKMALVWLITSPAEES